MMKISINWLQEYISLLETPQEIANLLTKSGLEVSHIESFESIPGNLAGLLIGQVITCTKHPNADKLSCTQVDIGREKHLKIVCGAPNVAVGQKVAVAPVGSRLHTYTGEQIHIKAAKIRGEISEGMLCAADEIGLGPSHEEILSLDTELPLGTPLSHYFNLKTDHILTIELTPNRIDACSHMGVARDLRALLNRPIEYPPLLQAIGMHQNSLLPIQVTIKDAGACPRYTGIAIAGVQVQASPKWIQDKLKAIGLNPINNVVDVTNLVMHELGQPLHAFDYSQIVGNQIQVRVARPGEKISTLDGIDRILVGEELLITDAHNNIALAGMLGGRSTAVTAKTTNIFLESAYFAPQGIRRAATHHKIQTDAAFRFERGTDPNIPAIALRRACLLIQEVTGGKIASPLIDIYPQPIQPVEVAVSYQNIQQLIGQSIPAKEIQSILHNLDIVINHDDGARFTALVPSYRVDVTREVDIIEEILRIYGYDKVQPPVYLQSTFLATTERPRFYQIAHQLSTILAANGYQEICTNSLIANQEAAVSQQPGQSISILNPLSDRLNILRNTLIFSGLEVLAHNIHRKQFDLKVFEVGKNYYQEDGQYIEKNKLGIWLTGKIEAANWIRQPREVSFQDLNTIIHSLLERLGIRAVSYQPLSNVWYKQGVAICEQSKQLVIMGQLEDALLQKVGIKQSVFFADIDIDQLSDYPPLAITYEPISKFPLVKRDLSLVIDDTVSFEDIKKILATQQESFVQDVHVFDVYQGTNLPTGKKAYALSFALQDKERTLDEKTINQVMARLIKDFQQTLGAVIRE